MKRASLKKHVEAYCEFNCVNELKNSKFKTNTEAEGKQSVLLDLVAKYAF